MGVFMPLWPTYTSFVLNSTRADHSHLSMAMLIPFVGLLILNAFLERRGIGFSPTELLAICCIGFVASTMQGEWLTVWFLQMLTMPAYYASPENRFDELLLPHMPSWTTITNRDAVRGFYEGQVPGTAFPWGEWFSVLFWWGMLIAGILTIHLCLSVLLRKQWMEYERLSFPVATALLELTGVSGTTGTLRTLVGNRLFQWGFGLTFAIIAWNVFTWFSVNLPMFPFLAGRYGRHVISVAPGFPSIVTTFVLLTFCLGYFTKLEVLFSLWFFHVVQICVVGLFNRFGLDLGANDPWSSSHPAIGWMTFGGMIVFVGWGFYIARSHFRDIFRKAVLRDESIDDSEEIMSYRTAVGLLLACCGFVFLWLLRAGMGPGAGSRLVLCHARPFCRHVPHCCGKRSRLSSRAPHRAGVYMARLWGRKYGGCGRLHFDPYDEPRRGWENLRHHANGPHSALEHGHGKAQRKAVAPTVLIGCLLGIAAVVGFVVYQGYYGIGSANFGRTTFKGIGSLNGAGFSRLAVSRLQSDALFTDWPRFLFLGIGGIFTAVLYYLRYRFPGFPIHPIGFTICGMVEMQDNSFSLFLIWGVKTVIMKLGGLERYRHYAPFFFGDDHGLYRRRFPGRLCRYSLVPGRWARDSLRSVKRINGAD